MSKNNQKKNEARTLARQKYEAGYAMVYKHAFFLHLAHQAFIRLGENGDYPGKGMAIVTKDGIINCNPKTMAEPAEWARVIAHCLLHLGMEHFVAHEHQIEWNMACDCIVEKFLTDMKFGKPWYHGTLPSGVYDEEKLYAKLCSMTDKSEYIGLGTAGINISDMITTNTTAKRNRYYFGSQPPKWDILFARGLTSAVTEAVRSASGEADRNRSKVSVRLTSAKKWFLSHYPLLGAIAANFKIIEDPSMCQRMQISIAAVSPSLAEIYINPAATLDIEELRFVMAHEFLHAALRHDERVEWRDEYLWNVACDYVINGWLTEMSVGERPTGLLYDEQFKGCSAEEIYDRIVTDMRTFRKLATLRGVGLGDILPGNNGANGDNGDDNGLEHTFDVDLDNFYRRALAQGLEYHNTQGRGYLPEGLIEDIRALSHPPIPWDVDLARWFDEYFTPLEKIRSYARPSRRQSSTPDIPQPNRIVTQASLDGGTYGVVLDTSGSMDRHLLASALGAIASYSAARDVPAVRVVFCDASAYDAGYMKPEDIAGTVKVKGRGGTILQPGVDLLHKAEDFPKDAPILIITDAQCDKIILYGRNHAFLIPHGATLPFSPKGKVFRMRL